MALHRISSRDPFIRKEKVKSPNGRNSKSDAQRDFDEFTQQYPPEKGWTERIRQRTVQKYSDGKWYAESLFYKVVDDRI